MKFPEKSLVPGTNRVFAVPCADGSVFYGFDGAQPGWEVPASVGSLTPEELRAIASHKEALLKAGFTKFS